MKELPEISDKGGRGMNYTKGPWKSRSKDQCVYGPAGVTICHCGNNGIYGDESYSISKKEAYGNARLISFAPDMLHTLIYANLMYKEKVGETLASIDYVLEALTGKTWGEIEELGNDG